MHLVGHLPTEKVTYQISDKSRGNYDISKSRGYKPDNNDLLRPLELGESGDKRDTDCSSESSNYLSFLLRARGKVG